MAVMPIVKMWDPTSQILMQPAMRVRDFDWPLQELLDDMLDTMRFASGVGLAAPQVGVNLRAAVIGYMNENNEAHVYELINPEIIKAKGSVLGREGCLSIPGIMAVVDRATYVVVRAQDRNGKEFRLKAYDKLARVIQHEVDHLYGILMTDKAVEKLVVKS